MIASASNDATVRIWDPRDGELLNSLREHHTNVRSVCFTADGKGVLSSGDGRHVSLSDVATGELLGRFEGHEHPVIPLALSADGETLVSGGFGKTIRVWDVGSFKQRAVLTGHADKVTGVDISRDSLTVASVCRDGTVRVWDVSTGKELQQFAGRPREHFSFVRFSPDGKSLCLPDAGGIAAVHSLKGNERQFLLEQFNGFGKCLDAAYSPDGTLLATSSAPSKVQIWDAQTGRLITSVADSQVSRGYQRLTPELRSARELFLEKVSQDEWKKTPAPEYSSDQALRFADGHVFIPELRYKGIHPITLEAWVRPKDLSGDRDVIGNPQNGGVFLALNKGRGGFGLHDGSGYRAVTSNKPVGAGRLIHIAGVFDGSYLKLFLDGILQEDRLTVSGQHKESTMPLTIGANPGPNNSVSNFFDGVIDEVRVSKVARYSEDFEPASRFETDADTIALYHFDEGKGEIVYDASGNGHHGLVRGATWVKGPVGSEKQ